MNSNFEDNLRKKFENFSDSPSAGAFENILRKNTLIRRHRMIRNYSIAGLLSLGILTAIYFMATDHNEPQLTTVPELHIDDLKIQDQSPISENEKQVQVTEHESDQANVKPKENTPSESIINLPKGVSNKSNTLDQLANRNIPKVKNTDHYKDLYNQILSQNENSDVNNAKIWTKLSDQPTEVPHRNIEVINDGDDQILVWKKDKNTSAEVKNNVSAENNAQLVKDSPVLAKNELSEKGAEDVDDEGKLEDSMNYKSANFDPETQTKSKNKYERLTLEASYGYGKAARRLMGPNRSLIENRNNSEISGYSDLTRFGVNFLLTEKWEINAGIIFGTRRGITKADFSVPYLREVIEEKSADYEIPGQGIITVKWNDTSYVEDVNENIFREKTFQRTLRIPLSISHTYYWDKYAAYFRGGVSIDVWTEEDQTWVVGERAVRSTPDLPLKTERYIRYQLGVGGGYRLDKNWLIYVMPMLDIGSNRIMDETLGIKQFDYGFFTTFGVRYNF
jgi:cytoskeletal protein RodZ